MDDAMPDDRLISVIIPTYNRAATLRRAIDSVLNQSHRALELIVVDDASTDGTVDLVRAIDDPRVRLIAHDRNRGAGAARNSGLEAARGAYVAFQDSDDEWLADKLAEQYAALSAAAPDCVGIYCVKVVYGRDSGDVYGARLASCVPGPAEAALSGDISDLLHQRNVISTQTLMLRKSAALAIGGFDTRLRNSIDWDFVMRLSEHGQILFVNRPLVIAYVMHDSISLPSKRSAYSMLIIASKMRRRAVAPRHVARHLAGLGTRLGYYDKPRMGRKLIRIALGMNPGDRKTWMRYMASYAGPLLRPLWLRRKRKMGMSASDGLIQAPMTAPTVAMKS